MDPLTNTFKRRLAGPDVLYGLFVGLADPVAAEIAAGAGFDWVMIDAEHGPNDIRTLLVQLQATAAYPVATIVRPPNHDPATIKRILDLGAQTLIVPMVSSADEAEALVAAVRYPPRGVRGVGTALARAARWNRIPDYLERADEEICLIAQIESSGGLENLAAIAAVDGVDALFVGPSDLAASLGHLGNPGHPEVQDAVVGALTTITAAGRPAGVYASTGEAATTYVGNGARFVAVGIDAALLATATRDLARTFRTDSG